MENSILRNLYSLYWLSPNSAGLIVSGITTHMQSFIKFRLVENFPKLVKYNNYGTFCTFSLSRYRLVAKPDDGPRRPMALNARNLPTMCFLWVSTKMYTPP